MLKESYVLSTITLDHSGVWFKRQENPWEGMENCRSQNISQTPEVRKTDSGKWRMLAGEINIQSDSM